MSESPLTVPLEYEPHQTEHRPLAPLLLLAAAVAVGFAIQWQDGEYTPVAIALVTAALLALGWAIAAPEISLPFPGRAGLGLSDALLLGMAGQFTALCFAWPGVDLARPRGAVLPILLIGVAVAGMLVCAIKVGPRPDVRRWNFRLLLLGHLALSIWFVRASPSPHIDVWYFQQGASQELLQGRDPYAMTFPDIYHSTLPGHQQVYGDGLVANDRLQFGFPYLPVSLLLALPGYVIGHDHRYSQAAALALAGLFIGSARPGRVAMLTAALFLFTPRVSFVLMRGWTEPFAVMLLAATVFCACRRSRWLPVALGLFLAAKQYMALALPLTFLLLPQPWSWRQWAVLLAKALAVTAIVTLPLALWDWHAFWRSTVTVQETAPFRWDALSYLVWYGFRGHLVTQPWTARFWSTLAAAVAILLVLRKAPRNPSGFAAGASLVFLAFFAFNKQAFCNYYFFVIGAVCCALAAWGPMPPRDTGVPPVLTIPGTGETPVSPA